MEKDGGRRREKNRVEWKWRMVVEGFRVASKRKFNFPLVFPFVRPRVHTADKLGRGILQKQIDAGQQRHSSPPPPPPLLPPPSRPGSRYAFVLERRMRARELLFVSGRRGMGVGVVFNKRGGRGGGGKVCRKQIYGNDIGGRRKEGWLARWK